MNRLLNFFKGENAWIWISISLCTVVIIMSICVSELEDNRLFNALLNLSYSILAAWFFYLVIEVFPKKDSEKKNADRMENHFNRLFSNLHIVMEMDRCIWKGVADDYSDISDTTTPYDLSEGQRYFFTASNYPSAVPFVLSLQMLYHHSVEANKEIDHICDLSSFWPINHIIIDSLIRMKEMPYLNRFEGMQLMNFDGVEGKMIFDMCIFPININEVYLITEELHKFTGNDFYSDFSLYKEDSK
jgi:hypothetical protein